jgi:preprotein translocase subunit SecE
MDSIISHRYFFLVVFFAFFAGAFFVAMDFSPPFTT